MIALGLVIVASFLHVRVADETESSQCRDLSVSLLQTHSMVQHSHTVPNSFFEDAAVVSNAENPRTNHHIAAQRQPQAEPIVPQFDVGRNAVPLPAWAAEDTRSPVMLTQSDTALARQASTAQAPQNGIAQNPSSRSLSERTLVPQEEEEAIQAVATPGRAQAEPMSTQAASEVSVEDPALLDVLETEPPLAAQPPLAQAQQSEERFDIAAQFVECQADAAGEDCMKAKRQGGPISLSQQLRQGVEDTIQEQRLPPGGELRRDSTMNSPSLDQHFDVAGNALEAPELLLRSAQRLEAQQKKTLSQMQMQQQQALFQMRMEQLKQLKHWERRQEPETPGADWYSHASVAEVRHYFETRATSRGDTTNARNGLQKTRSESELAAMQHQIPATPISLSELAAGHHQIPATATSPSTLPWEAPAESQRTTDKDTAKDDLATLAQKLDQLSQKLKQDESKINQK